MAILIVMVSIQDLHIPTDYGHLHARAASLSSGLTPVVLVPGMLGKAEDWDDDLEAFAPRPTVALSLRGRGGSDAPEKGFAIADHAKDIEALAQHLNFKKMILVGFSQGALYATSFASQNASRIAALIIQDKSLKQKKFGQEWVDRARNHPMAKDREDFLWAIANDSQNINLLESCESLKKTPVLVIKGEDSPMLLEEDLQELKETFPTAQVKIFAESGHDISMPDYDRYVRTMKTFMDSLG